MPTTIHLEPTEFGRDPELGQRFDDERDALIDSWLSVPGHEAVSNALCADDVTPDLDELIPALLRRVKGDHSAPSEANLLLRTTYLIVALRRELLPRAEREVLARWREHSDDAALRRAEAA